jgi:hypothetical protein
MADYPILFSAPMVRAILAGHKTQTRRVLKPQPYELCEGEIPKQLHISVGDCLWVREAWRTHRSWDADPPRDIIPASPILYEADAVDLQSRIDAGKYRHARFMPRWVSRLTLTVTDVRVQRLQDISRDDAIEEGIVQTWGDFFDNPPDWAIKSVNQHGSASGSHIYDNRTSVENYRELWNHINGPGAWDTNPWVVAYTFTSHLGNINSTEANHG